MSHNVTYRAQGNPSDVSVAMAVLAPTTLAVKGFRLGVVQMTMFGFQSCTGGATVGFLIR
jgi:hypothetical protein